MQTHYLYGILFSALTLISVPLSAATAVGEVSFSRGVLTGQIDNEAPRILGKGLPLHNGETLNTGSRGFAMIKLEDGSRMTLRPNTTFKIEDIDTREGSENALLKLFRGGFRAITGFISKRRPDSFKVTTSVATIGIRGTEFDARLCEGTECEQESRATGQKAQNESMVIGRIALLRGKANAVDVNASSRVLTTGAAVYEQDQLQTGIKSFAVIAFNDKSRVTMSPGTAFKIEEHRYRPDVPDENNAFLSFIRGGLRLITGAIGKLNRQSYRVSTPTATIGIRGTGFDLVCDGDCSSNSASLNPLRESVASRLMNYFLKPVIAQTGSGMYARVWNGEIEFQNESGKFVLPAGRTAFVKNAFSRPRIVPNIPIQLRNMGGAPRPDKIKFDESLFNTAGSTDIKPGLYISVRDGDVTLLGTDGSKTFVGRGEAALAGLNGSTVRLGFVPLFQKFDKVPEPGQVTPKMQERSGSLFGDPDSNEQGFECRLQ
jgi:hypothetical protein